MSIHLATLGSEHPSTAVAYLGLGAATGFLGEGEASLQHYRRALAIVEKS